MKDNDYLPCNYCNGSGGHGFHDGRKIHCMPCEGTGLSSEELMHPEHTDTDDWPEKKKVGTTIPKEKEHSPDSLLGQARDKFGIDMGKPGGTPIFTQTNPQGEPSFGFTPFAGTGTPMKNPAAEIFRRSHPMDLAWRIIKGD